MSLSDQRTVELIGGPLDGQVMSLSSSCQELKVPTLGGYSCSICDVHSQEPPTVVLGRYTWETQADRLLNRWTWQAPTRFPA